MRVAPLRIGNAFSSLGCASAAGLAVCDWQEVAKSKKNMVIIKLMIRVLQIADQLIVAHTIGSKIIFAKI
jgi:hypothetical protein